MYFDSFTALVFASVGFAFVFANIAIGSVIRPRRRTEEGLEVFECGEETRGDAWVRFDIRYYTVALVYVIFAVEIAFLFPWAIVLNEAMAGTGAAEGLEIGAFALVEGVIFITILFLGLAYVWAKGDLDWILTYKGDHFAPSEPRSERASIPSIQQLEEARQPAEDDEEKEEKEEEPEEVAV
jgi:NADH-quinone oxidoreductase subunit A